MKSFEHAPPAAAGGVFRSGRRRGGPPRHEKTGNAAAAQASKIRIPETNQHWRRTAVCAAARIRRGGRAQP